MEDDILELYDALTLAVADCDCDRLEALEVELENRIDQEESEAKSHEQPAIH